MKDGFKLTIETMHAPDRGTQENVHQLPPEQLKQREVVWIDIANDPSPVRLSSTVFCFYYNMFIYRNINKMRIQKFSSHRKLEEDH